MAGLAGAAGLSPASALASAFGSVFGAAGVSTGLLSVLEAGVSTGLLSGLGAGAALAEKLSAMRLALASSTLEAWLLTSKPSS